MFIPKPKQITKSSLKLQITTSQYIGQQKYYDFNSINQNQFIFNFYQCKYQPNIYFYQKIQQPKQIIISNTMDCFNQYHFLFKLEIEEEDGKISFWVKNLREVIQDNQSHIYSKQKINQRLKPKQKLNNPHQNPHTLTKYYNLNSKPLKGYIQHQIQKIQQIYLVPRYMKPIQLQQNMVLHYHFKQIYSSQLTTKDIKVNNLILQYAIEQINKNQVINDYTLPNQNQQNLLHICQPITSQQSNTDNTKKCFVCFQTSSDDFDKKYPNIFVDACYCSGDLKSHLKCLASIISYQQTGQVICCKTCKKPFPQFLLVSKIQQNQQINYKFFKLIGKDNGPYVKLNQKKIPLYSKQIISIGSNQSSQLYFSAAEKYKYTEIHYDSTNQKAYIHDSKKNPYGTLIKKQKMKMVFDKNFYQPITFSVLVNLTLFYINLSISYK